MQLKHVLCCIIFPTDGGILGNFCCKCRYILLILWLCEVWYCHILCSTYSINRVNSRNSF